MAWISWVVMAMIWKRVVCIAAYHTTYNYNMQAIFCACAGSPVVPGVAWSAVVLTGTTSDDAWPGWPDIACFSVPYVPPYHPGPHRIRRPWASAAACWTGGKAARWPSRSVTGAVSAWLRSFAPRGCLCGSRAPIQASLCQFIRSARQGEVAAPLASAPLPHLGWQGVGGPVQGRSGRTGGKGPRPSPGVEGPQAPTRSAPRARRDAGGLPRKGQGSAPWGAY